MRWWLFRTGAEDMPIKCTKFSAKTLPTLSRAVHQNVVVRLHRGAAWPCAGRVGTEAESGARTAMLRELTSGGNSLVRADRFVCLNISVHYVSFSSYLLVRNFNTARDHKRRHNLQFCMKLRLPVKAPQLRRPTSRCRSEAYRPVPSAPPQVYASEMG